MSCQWKSVWKPKWAQFMNFSQFSPFQYIRLQTNPGASGHLGLVMAKLGEINFNLERAIECTWPRTLRDGRRVLLWPLLPQIGPTGWLVCASFMSALLWHAESVPSHSCNQYFGSQTNSIFYTWYSLYYLMFVRKKGTCCGKTKLYFSSNYV